MKIETFYMLSYKHQLPHQTKSATKIIYFFEKLILEGQTVPPCHNHYYKRNNDGEILPKLFQFNKELKWKTSDTGDN